MDSLNDDRDDNYPNKEVDDRQDYSNTGQYTVDSLNDDRDDNYSDGNDVDHQGYSNTGQYTVDSLNDVRDDNYPNKDDENTGQRTADILHSDPFSVDDDTNHQTFDREALSYARRWEEAGAESYGIDAPEPRRGHGELDGGNQIESTDMSFDYLKEIDLRISMFEGERNRATALASAYENFSATSKSEPPEPRDSGSIPPPSVSDMPYRAKVVESIQDSQGRPRSQVVPPDLISIGVMHAISAPIVRSKSVMMGVTGRAIKAVAGGTVGAKDFVSRKSYSSQASSSSHSTSSPGPRRRGEPLRRPSRNDVSTSTVMAKDLGNSHLSNRTVSVGDQTESARSSAKYQGAGSTRSTTDGRKSYRNSPIPQAGVIPKERSQPPSIPSANTLQKSTVLNPPTHDVSAPHNSRVTHPPRKTNTNKTISPNRSNTYKTKNNAMDPKRVREPSPRSQLKKGTVEYSRDEDAVRNIRRDSIVRKVQGEGDAVRNVQGEDDDDDVRMSKDGRAILRRHVAEVEAVSVGLRSLEDSMRTELGKCSDSLREYAASRRVVDAEFDQRVDRLEHLVIHTNKDVQVGQVHHFIAILVFLSLHHNQCLDTAAALFSVGYRVH